MTIMIHIPLWLALVGGIVGVLGILSIGFLIYLARIAIALEKAWD